MNFSEKMLAVARRGEVPENLVFEQADACALPYEDNCFDCISYEKKNIWKKMNSRIITGLQQKN